MAKETAVSVVPTCQSSKWGSDSRRPPRQKTIEMKEMEESIDKVSRALSAAVNAWASKTKSLPLIMRLDMRWWRNATYADPPHKVSIIARGMAGGYTRMLPEDRAYWSKSRLTDSIAVSLAGLCSENSSSVKLLPVLPMTCEWLPLMPAEW